MLKVKCHHCSEMRAARSKRRGFLQTRIMPFFGYYPWECRACRVRYYRKERGEPQPRRRIDVPPTGLTPFEEPTAEQLFGSASEAASPQE